MKYFLDLFHTYYLIVRFHIRHAKTILDVGCGNGHFMSILNKNKKFYVIGIELFSPYIRQASSLGVFKRIIKKDIRKISYPKNSFDVVLCSQVIEHLKKKDGLALINKMKAIAKDKVIIGTPNGHLHQDTYDGNALQKHLSRWTVNDFRKLGFSVYGQSLKIIYGEEGFLDNYLEKSYLEKIIGVIISYIASPLVYFFPSLGAQLICVYSK